MYSTQYLTAVLIYCVYTANFMNSKKSDSEKNVENLGAGKGMKLKNPIKICVPVNLKRYFSQKSISNFFSYITVSANQEIMLENGILSFDKILSFVKNDFKIKLTQEEIQKTVSTNVRLEQILLLSQFHWS